MRFSSLSGSNEVAAALERVIPEGLSSRDMCIICIGTDRSTGDSYGPLVGTFLKQMGYDIMGDLEDPIHALNLIDRIETIGEGKFILAIDSMLGQVTSVGTHFVSKGPIKPGAGVQRELPEIGDASIGAVVNVGGFMEYFVLQNTRLNLVMKLAKDGADAIHNVLAKRDSSAIVLQEVN